MSMAQVGDDGYGEDSSVNRLEELGAEIAGKEAALFVPSGTAGNIIAVATHTERGDEVITEIITGWEKRVDPGCQKVPQDVWGRYAPNRLHGSSRNCGN